MMNRNSNNKLYEGRRNLLFQAKPLMLMNLALVFFLIVLTQVKPVEHLREYCITRVTGTSDQKIFGEKTISQTFSCSGEIDSFELQMNVASGDYHGYCDVTIFDENDDVIKSWHVDKLDLANGIQRKDGWVDWGIETSGETSEGVFRIEISASDLEQEDAVVVKTSSAVALSSEDRSRIQNCVIDGEETDQVLAFSTYRKHDNIFFVLAVFTLFITANSWWLIKDKKTEITAPVILLGTGFIMFFIMAPGSQPDESYHYATALALSDVMLGQNENIYEIDEELRPYNTWHYNDNHTYLRLLDEEGEEIPENYRSGVPAYPSAVDGLKYPLGYLAPATGISIARVANLGYAGTYSLARLFELLAYMAMAITAIRLMPYNKELMLLICIMPMSMHQAVSTSRDVLVNGLSMVFFAYYMKILYEGKPFTWKQVGISVLLLAVFGPIKVIYCILAFLILIIPKSQFRNRVDRLFKILFIPAGTLVILLVQEWQNLNWQLNSATAAGGADYYHLQFVLEHPVRYLRLIFGSMESRGWNYIKEVVGTTLAGRSVTISEYLAIGFMIILLLCVCNETRPGLTLDRRQRIVMLGVPLLGYVLLTVSFSFVWTKYGTFPVSGIQGRYLIPFVPLVLYGLINNKIRGFFNARHLFYGVWVIEMGYIVDVMSQIRITV